MQATTHPRPRGDAAGARIGPNAILQMGLALRRAHGAQIERQLFASAGLAGYLEAPPTQLVPESDVIALHSAVREALPPALGRAVAEQAGHATGLYLLEHRIPRPAHALLHLLPRALAARVLAAAIRRNAWTFAGSGQLRVQGGARPVFTLAGCPLCRGLRSAAPACGYYRATFERLFRELVDGGATVAETECLATGGACCRFEVRWG